MTHDPEVKILPRGPDRGNSTPRRQVRGVEHHPRLRADRGRPVRGRAEEVVGARRFRTRVKHRKAHPEEKAASRAYVRYLSVLRVGIGDGIDAKFMSLTL